LGEVSGKREPKDGRHPGFGGRRKKRREFRGTKMGGGFSVDTDKKGAHFQREGGVLRG